MYSDLANPQGFQLFYWHVTTYHWLVTALENRGIPQRIIDKWREVEPFLEVKASASPLYQNFAEQIRREVAKNFYYEGPPKIKHQEHRWVVCTQDPKTYGEIYHFHRSLATACEVFTDFGLEPDIAILIVLSNIEFLNFLAAEFIELAEEWVADYSHLTNVSPRTIV